MQARDAISNGEALGRMILYVSQSRLAYRVKTI